MQPLHRGRTPVVNPHHLTPNALLLAKGESAYNITEADYQSYCAWEERCRLLEAVWQRMDEEELKYSWHLSALINKHKVNQVMLSFEAFNRNIARAVEALNKYNRSVGNYQTNQ